MSANGEPSELSWLKGDKSEGSDKSKSSTPPPTKTRSPAEDKQIPSWLLDDNKEDGGGTDPEPKKYAEPKNKKRIRDLLQSVGSDEESEEDCCFCCHSDPLLLSFQLFHFTSGLVGMAALAANVYAFATNLSLNDAILRAYAVLFCLLIVLVEVDWRYFVNRIRFVEIWLLRGLFYAFVALLTGGVGEKTAMTPQNLVAIVLGAVGVCYFLLVGLPSLLSALLFHSPCSPPSLLPLRSPYSLPPLLSSHSPHPHISLIPHPPTPRHNCNTTTPTAYPYNPHPHYYPYLHYYPCCYYPYPHLTSLPLPPPLPPPLPHVPPPPLPPLLLPITSGDLLYESCKAEAHDALSAAAERGPLRGQHCVT